MSTIITYTGQLVDVLSPKSSSIRLEDIAHGLAYTCRWGGHCREFYSVAQHSVIVSQFVKEENALYGLLHDASEAYLTDLPKPIKLSMPEYQHIEANFQEKVFITFGLSEKYPKDVHDIDIRLMLTEAIELGMHPHLWADFRVKTLPIVIKPLPPKEAKKKFLDRFKEIKQV